MNSYFDRVYRFKGNPYEIGFAAEQTFVNNIEKTISHYIASVGPSKDL